MLPERTQTRASVGCEGVLLTTNASCDPVPLPERLYAGGATSHRGFGINDAGPRDLTTGYPVGGTAVFVNSFELRLPPPVLPIVGDSVSFVIFHDMGNAFLHAGDMFKSIARFQQPNQQTMPPGYGLCHRGHLRFRILPRTRLVWERATTLRSDLSAST